MPKHPGVVPNKSIPSQPSSSTLKVVRNSITIQEHILRASLIIKKDKMILCRKIPHFCMASLKILSRKRIMNKIVWDRFRIVCHRLTNNSYQIRILHWKEIMNNKHLEKSDNKLKRMVLNLIIVPLQILHQRPTWKWGTFIQSKSKRYKNSNRRQKVK